VRRLLSRASRHDFHGKQAEVERIVRVLVCLAEGLTDHVWSLKEVLLYRVPPWPQPQAV
jgi:hypothetical protein